MSNASKENKMNVLARFRHRLKHERGAVLVEAAICIPLLIIVIFGAVEAGLAWEAKSSSVSGVRTGVLRAASIGDEPETDLRIIQSIIGEVGAENADRIDWVMVFEVDPVVNNADADFASCLALAPNGSGNGCIVYPDTFINNVLTTTDSNAFLTANFDEGAGAIRDPSTTEVIGYDCQPGKVDFAWCAGSRTVGGDTTIGVAIQYQHEWFTGILPFGPPQFQEFVVSSTFVAEGTDINPSGGLPLVSGSTVFSSTAGAFAVGTDLSANPDVNFSAVATDGGALSVGIDDPPTGASYLGPVASGTISVDLTNQAPGEVICVSFDLLIIGSWDAGGTNGPDTFGVVINGVEVEPITVYTQDTAAVDPRSLGTSNSLGYEGTRTHGQNEVLRINVCAAAPTSATGDVNIDFVGSLVQGGNVNTNTNDEGFGIDNLEITSDNP